MAVKEISLKKNLSWNIVGMVLYNFAIWVFSALILRMLGTTISGYYAIATSIGNTFYATALWGMRSFIVADQHHQYTYCDYICTRLIAIIVSILLTVGSLFIFNYELDIKFLIVTYSLFKFSEAFIELFDCFGQLNLIMDINAKSMVMRGVIYIALFYATLNLKNNVNIAFVVLFLTSIFIAIFYNLRKINKLIHIGWNINVKNVLKVLKLCTPIMVFELLAAAIVAIPRLFYESVGSIDQLGIYTSIYTMVVFLQLVINVLIYTLAPYMAKAYEQNNIKQFKKYILYMVCGAIGLSMVAEGLTYLIGQPVMSLIFGVEAGSYYEYLYLSILSGLSLTFTWMISQICVIVHHINSQLVCSICSVIVCSILSYLFIDGSDCNMMSIVLMFANLSFVFVALIMLRVELRESL